MNEPSGEILIATWLMKIKQLNNQNTVALASNILLEKQVEELKARVKYLEDTIDRFPEEGDSLLIGYYKWKKDKEASNDE